MSSRLIPVRMSCSSIEDWSSSRRNERTPLRSLENDVLHMSTLSSRLGSKPRLGGDAASLGIADVHLCDVQTQLGSSRFFEGVPTLPVTMDTAQNAGGLGDVTFKSFICPGGEVEISAPSVCGGESSNPGVEQLDSPRNSFAWKSLTCDGGEVEVSNSPGSQEKDIRPPWDDLRDPQKDDSPELADCTRPFALEHVDHPYCISELDLISATQRSETPTDGLADLTLKPFNCTGGEVEISADADLADDTIPLSHSSSGENVYNCNAELSVLASDNGLENGKDHLDHPYCHVKYVSSLPTDLDPVQDPLVCCAGENRELNSVVPDEQDEDVCLSSVNVTVGDAGRSGYALLSKNSYHPEDQSGSDPTLTSLKENPAEDAEQSSNYMEEGRPVFGSQLPPDAESALTNAALKPVDDVGGNAELSEDVPPDCSHLAASVETPLREAVAQQLDYVSHSASRCPESIEAKDSALGSSGPVLCLFAEKAPETSPDILRVLSECPSVASALQFLSPIVKRASLKLPTESHKDRFLAEDSALEGEKSLVAPANVDPAGLFEEHLESPMPRPLFNSTVLGAKPQPGSAAEQEDSGRKPQSEAAPLIPEGQLQQQLRQMAEFLIMACGKMGSASAPTPAAFRSPSEEAVPAGSRSICVGTSPVRTTDHGLNTSGIFVRKREFSVADSCTVTEPLIWNLPPGSLESLPRPELEQRLMSSMIMVEALVQQLAAARAHCSPSSGPAPSDLREKLVQTDHTELSQTSMYRDLYMEALSRIGELELDGSSLQNVVQAVQDVRATMFSLTTETDAALSNVKEMGETAREDHQDLASHYQLMKSLLEKSKDSQTRILEKTKEVLHQRNDMRTHMEEAFTAKEAAFSAMDQLRTRCASEISALEKCVGSQQELLAALNQAYPAQVALNKTCRETLNSAAHILSQTVEEHSGLMDELCTVRSLLQKTAPTLARLNQKAAAALRERDDHCSARERAVEERQQTEEELDETRLNLQTATQQISDLNLQITILTSEMGVLRQKLTDKEEETGQLERKVTELSATISSTLASYTFLEQALAAETTKLQQSWKDVHQANERVNQLEVSLEDSEQRVSELNRALAESDEQLSQLRKLSQSQSVQIQQLQDVCAQLGGVREMNEFLQMENELAREQVAESERMLRTNLQALRERNIECEDLKGEVSELRAENKSLRDELEAATCASSAARLDLQEKMAQAACEITVLHHTLRGLTTELQASLSEQREQQQKHKESAPLTGAERQQPSSSFVDSVMVALTAEKQEDIKADLPSVSSDESEPQSEALFSKTSAFTRVAAPTPKKNSSAPHDEQQQQEEEQNRVAELLSLLGATVTELISTLRLVQRCRDAKLQELHNTIGSLQVELQSSDSRHSAEVLELKQELRRLSSLAERGNQALQQKTQDEKTLTKLMEDVQEAQQILSKHKSDNNELRKDVTELRRALQQSRVESQVLREELSKAGGPSAVPVRHVEEKIHLHKEVERLKAGLQEAEQAKVKLLERAKRHQIIHQTNQQKTENELQILNHMINKVRQTLLSVPEVVKRCEALQQLVDYIG